MLPVTSLTIVYDPTCGLCTAAKDWLRKQEPLVGLDFVSEGWSTARHAFSQLPPGELAVVADTGEFWLGNHAWIICLWALRDYRDLAFRLTSPGLERLACEAFSLVSRNRSALSSLLKLHGEREMEQQLRKETVLHCQTRK
jgi:predicted DCC family thiol-disulfide oxidoreductase YuxK